MTRSCTKGPWERHSGLPCQRRERQSGEKAAGKDTAIIHTHGYAVTVKGKRGRVLFSSDGEREQIVGRTVIKVRGVEKIKYITISQRVKNQTIRHRFSWKTSGLSLVHGL